MLRNVHYFHFKPAADKDRILHLLDHDLADFAKSLGCIERKTWRLLDARAHGQPITDAEYINEALWPSQEVADAFGQAERSDAVNQFLSEIFGAIEIEKTVRYVDEGG